MAQNDQVFKDFWNQVAGSGEGLYQPAMQSGLFHVQTINYEEGIPVSATGTLDGSGEFTVPMKGRSFAVNDFFEVEFPANQPVGADLAYIRHVSSDYPGAGLVLIDANLPSPTGLGVTSAIVSGPGSIRADATVSWVAVEPKYQPSGYTISYRVSGGGWTDIAVPHIGGTQSVVIRGLPPGATLDVHARTRYLYTASESIPTSDVSHTLAADSASPGAVTAVTGDVTRPNTLRISVTSTINPDLLRGYVYYIHTAPTGSPAITHEDPSSTWDAVLTPGTYYIAAAPISKSGVLGTRIPGSGFQGPYTVIAPVVLDTTPPANFSGAPTLTTQTVQGADGAWHGYMTVTRPSYSEPADYARTEISFVVDDGRKFPASMPAGDTFWKGEVGFGQFTVAIRGVDKSGNASTFSATAIATIPKPALSTTTPTVIPETVATGIKLNWGQIDGAQDYEVQRASTNTPGSNGYLTEVAADAPLVWLQANETSGAAIDSGSRAINGTYNNSPGIHKEALLNLFGTGYDGVDDFISIPDAADLRITGNLTLEAWIYPTTRADYQMIFTKGNGGTGEYQLYLGITTGLPWFVDTNGALSGTTAPPLNQWSHIAVTRNGRVVTHYLNGLANGSGTIAGAAPATTTNPLYIGRRNEAAPQFFFNGRIAHPAIYTSVLSATRIGAHSAALTNPPAVTIGYSAALWLFDPLADDTLILPTYWYRVRARSVNDGVLITGTWSPWTQGVAGAVDAQNLRLRSITAQLIAAGSITANEILAGTIDASRLAATLVITQLLKTAISGPRWELEGHTGSGIQDQLRFYDASTLAMMLNGLGINFYNSSAGVDFSLARNGVGRGKLTMQGMYIEHDGTRPVISINTAASGAGLGQMRFAGLHGTDIWQEGTYMGAYNTNFLTRAYDGNDVPTLAINDSGIANVYTGLYRDGIAAVAGGNELSIRRNGTNARWNATTFAGLKTGLAAGYSAGYEYGHFYNFVLPSTGGGLYPFHQWEYYATDTNLMNLSVAAYKGNTQADWGECRFMLRSGLNNSISVELGSLQLGARVYSPFWALGTGGTSHIFLNEASNRIETTRNVQIGGNLVITGSLSKGTGSFVIDDPTPGYEGYQLRHTFNESPSAGENSYSYKIAFGPKGGGLAVEGPDGEMIEGATITDLGEDGVARWLVSFPTPDYWPYLNRRPRLLASNSGEGWGRVKARISEDLTTLTVLAEEGGEYTILLTGVRKDPVAEAWWSRRKIRKTKGQQWTNEDTMLRRNQSVKTRTDAKEYIRAMAESKKAPATTKLSDPKHEDMMDTMAKSLTSKWAEIKGVKPLWQ